jgi:hypothetical protein
MRVHRQQGAAGFFQQPRRRSANVLPPDVKQRAQAQLDEGKSVPEVSREIGVAGCTKPLTAGGCTQSRKSADRRRRQFQQ